MQPQIFVDARRLRHGPRSCSGALLFPDSDCGGPIGLTLRACGVPAAALKSDAWLNGARWPDALPRRWLSEYRVGAGLLPTVCDLFDNGAELHALAMLVGAFAAIGQRLEFVSMPDPFEVPTFNPQTDGRSA